MPISLANINVGSGPGVGDGATLRSAFITINDNFNKIQNNVNAINTSVGVSSVAGRTGNVVITIADILGMNNYTTISYVNSYVNSVVANVPVGITSNIASVPGSTRVLNIIACTQAQYDALPAKSPTTLYIING